MCRLLILVVYSFVGSLGVVCSTPLLPSSYHWFVQRDLFICCWLFSLLLVAVIVVTCLSFVVVSYFCLLLFSLLLLSLLLLLLLLLLVVVIVVDCCYSIGFSTTHHLKPRNTVGHLPCVLYREDLLSQP